MAGGGEFVDHLAGEAYPDFLGGGPCQQAVVNPFSSAEPMSVRGEPSSGDQNPVKVFRRDSLSGRRKSESPCVPALGIQLVDLLKGPGSVGLGEGESQGDARIQQTGQGGSKVRFIGQGEVDADCVPGEGSYAVTEPFGFRSAFCDRHFLDAFREQGTDYRLGCHI